MSTDLFGDPLTEDKPAPVGPIQKLKAHLKYREGTKTKCCGTCSQHRAFDYHEKIYHKCMQIGFSHSEATDIRLKNVCDRWEARSK